MKYPGPLIALFLAACGSQSGSKAPEVPTSPRPAGVSAHEPAVARDEGAIALLNALVEPRQQGRYSPRDECGKVTGATEFRRKLADAVMAKDAEAIAALASPEVRLGFGGDDGRERLLARLKDPNDTLIGEIARLLPLGCGLNVAGDLTMPWIFAQELGDIDGYTANLVVGENVPLHAAADEKSAVEQRISWDLVELADGPYPEGDLLPVTAPDGTKGYMHKSRLRSLLDYRLLAGRQIGVWKITAILAGD